MKLFPEEKWDEESSNSYVVVIQWKNNNSVGPKKVYPQIFYCEKQVTFLLTCLWPVNFKTKLGYVFSDYLIMKLTTLDFFAMTVV